MRKILMAAVVLAVSGSLAWAAVAFGPVTGIVQEYDRDGQAITLEGKDGETLTLKSPQESICYSRRTGSMDDLQEGREAEVEGKLSEDGKTLVSPAMIVYPGSGRGNERILGDGIRVDGRLAKKDGDWYVTVKDRMIRIEMKPGYRVTASENFKLADIEAGDKIDMYAQVVGGEVRNPTYIIVTKQAQ